MIGEERPELAQISVRAFLNAKLSDAEEDKRLQQEVERLDYARRLRKIAAELYTVSDRKRRYLEPKHGRKKKSSET